MTLLATILDHLDRRTIRYAHLHDGRGVSFVMNCAHSRIYCFVTLREMRRYVSVRTVSSLIVNEEARQVVAEFITRANYGLAVGRFEMDYEDGEIAFLTSSYLGGAELSDDLLEPMIDTNIHTHDRYFPGFIDVLYKGIAPKLAVYNVENPTTACVSSDEMNETVRRLLEGLGDDNDAPHFTDPLGIWSCDDDDDEDDEDEEGDAVDEDDEASEDDSDLCDKEDPNVERSGDERSEDVVANADSEPEQKEKRQSAAKPENRRKQGRTDL